MNPADLHRNDSLPALDSSPPMSAKTLPGALKTKPVANTVPRVDTEPIYTQLKAAVGEQWGEYKTALSAFMMGKLNQAELARTLTPLLPSTTIPGLPSPLHLHNTLVTALYANIFRDAPPENVASWVLATDAPSATHGGAGAGKTSTGGAGGAGDKAEERLKREVMALSARDRRRIKSVKESTHADGTAVSLLETNGLVEGQEYKNRLAVRAEAVGGAASSGAGLSNKTNWDLEVRRRFAMPLAVESLEFPSKNDVQARIEPICYEEGLGGGVAAGALPACAELMEAAAEMFVKEMLEGWFSIARVNGEALVHTNKYRRQLRREEAAEESGELGRNLLGYLPVEADAISRQQPLSLDEVRLALRLDEGRLATDPFLGNTILQDGFADMEIEEEEENGKLNGLLPKLDLKTPNINGHGSKRAAIVGPMALDDGDWGWQGASTSDRDTLMDVLSGTLTVSS